MITDVMAPIAMILRGDEMGLFFNIKIDTPKIINREKVAPHRLLIIFKEMAKVKSVRKKPLKK